jgi:hypothetical protein
MGYHELQPHELAHLDQGNVLVRIQPLHRYTYMLMWLIQGNR